MSPDGVNSDTKAIYALAIFILDSITGSDDSEEKYGKLREQLWDDGDEDKIDEDVYYALLEDYTEMGSHPCYREGLILDTLWVLALRNCDYLSYEKERTGHKGYSFLVDKYTSAIVKPKRMKGNFELRKRFETIMSLVSREDVDDAVEAFKDLFFRLIDCFLESREKLREARRKLEGRRELLEIRMREAEDRDRISVLESMKDFERREEKLNFCEVNFNDNYTDGLVSLPKFNDRYCSSFSSVTVPDPYKVIFGFFWLLENGDDHAWLMSASTAAFAFASYRLPWNDEINSGTLDSDDPVTNGKCRHSEGFYQALVDGEELGFGKYTDSYNAPQAIYYMNNVIVPRFLADVPHMEKLSTMLDQDTLEDYRRSYLLSYYASHRMHYFSKNDERSVDEEMSTLKKMHGKLQELQAEIDNLNNEIDREKEKGRVSADEKTRLENLRLSQENLRLNSENDELRRKVEAERKKAEKISEESRNEREELYSLRELIAGDMNAGVQDKADTAEEGSSWPYETESNICVVGGHPDWINKMKALLPTVKFYGDRVPARETLRNTDVVWIQTKVFLSHSTFYSLMNSVRSNETRIRYFPSDGVLRCAGAVRSLDTGGNGK